MKKLEAIRFKLKMEAEQADIDEMLTFETLWVAQSMSWTIEYVLELGIDAYNNVIAFLLKQREEMEKRIGMPIQDIRTLG